MDILTLQDKIARGEYRSDRFPAVPFVTFADVLKPAVVSPLKTKNHPECGASLTVGRDRVYFCSKRLGHVWSEGTEHDWAGLL